MSIIVLDDITPQYIKATYALNACHASLGADLRFLLHAGRHGRRSVRLTAH